LAFELAKRGLDVRRQVPIAIEYESVKLDVGYRIDLLVGELVVIELKAVDVVQPIHSPVAELPEARQTPIGLSVELQRCPHA
jgi:GxxExxY protein